MKSSFYKFCYRYNFLHFFQKAPSSSTLRRAYLVLISPIGEIKTRYLHTITSTHRYESFAFRRAYLVLISPIGEIKTRYLHTIRYIVVTILLLLF